MKIAVVGTGQGGCNIADEFVAMAKRLWKNRHIRIFTGGGNDPICRGVFAINLGASDLYGLRNIPSTQDHTILLGVNAEFRGRGAGKVNAVGAEQARLDADRIVSTIKDHGDIGSADAILVIATTAGGTGSGSVGVIVDLLKDAFEKPVYAMLVLPFENQYDDPDSVINTATCLKRVLDNSQADAIFLVDNQKVARSGGAIAHNYAAINRRIADSFIDILSVGEETDRKYIGEVLDANDLIRVLHGPTAIGRSGAKIPKKSQPWLERFKRDAPKARHFSVSKAQTERAQQVLHQSFGELSIDCGYWEDGETLYDAQKVLGLFSGPASEATEEAVEIMDNSLSELVPGAGRRKGTYPGRDAANIGVTVVVSDLGRGAAMDRVEFFYSEATRMMEDVQEKGRTRKSNWERTAKVGGLLPSI